MNNLLCKTIYLSKYVKKLGLFLFLLIICGCNNFQKSGSKIQQNPSNCPSQPKYLLAEDVLKSVSLNKEVTSETGRVNQNQFVGYTFQGKAGEHLNYQTNQDICIWVYTSEGQMLNDPALPKTGKYIIQVSAVKGSTTFELKMSLGDTAVVSLEPTLNDVKVVYNVTVSPDWQHSERLQIIVDEILDTVTAKRMPKDSLSITLIDVNTNEFAAYQQEHLRYPASVAKLFWMTILYGELQKGLLPDEKVFASDLEKMVVKSDNEATSRIIDKITETTSGTELVGEEFQTWLNKRYQMNLFFEQAGYGKMNISQKTFPIPSEKLYEPKGRDLQMRGDLQNPIRNKITTEQTARLMYEIVKGQAISPEYSQKMASWLAKDLNLEIWRKLDPNAGEFNPVRTFFGESLPKDVYFLSKAGWTSKTRQEVAFIRTRSGKTAYILSIFAEDKIYAQDGNIFPQLSRLVFERMINNGEIASAQFVSSPSKSNKSQPFGWIRIGAVKNTANDTVVGERLISTALPISISSATVPAIGEQVTIKVAVNLRADPPQPPNYNLAEKLGVSKLGQKVVIRKLETFIDPTTNPPYKVVWAEVESSP